MIRVIAFAALVFLLWFGLSAAVGFFRNRKADWPGVAFAVGFVMLAFWLHQVTGTAYLFG